MPAVKNTESLFVPFYKEKGRNESNKNVVLGWNSYYKKMHKFNGERLIVVGNLEAKDFNKKSIFSVRCPKCFKKNLIKTAELDEKMGEELCSGCKCRFGLHPAGRVITTENSIEPLKKDSIVNIKSKVSIVCYQQDLNSVISSKGILVEFPEEKGEIIKNYFSSNGVAYEDAP